MEQRRERSWLGLDEGRRVRTGLLTISRMRVDRKPVINCVGIVVFVIIVRRILTRNVSSTRVVLIKEKGSFKQRQGEVSPRQVVISGLVRLLYSVKELSFVLMAVSIDGLVGVSEDHEQTQDSRSKEDSCLNRHQVLFQPSSIVLRRDGFKVSHGILV